MNKLVIFFLLSILFTAELFGQSQGISYQAVIIDENDKEIPGVDVKGNYLPSQSLTVRFTILNESGDVDYQEEHKTTTDEYGMISLIIGWGTPTTTSPTVFTDMDWNGSPKDLQVEISLGEEGASDFVELSYQPLHFVPYAFHKNITATGTLTVDGRATFNGEAEFQDLTVMGTSNLNGVLNVNNGSLSNLSGDLNVQGVTRLSNSLTVEQTTILNDNLIVNSATGLNGQVTITADVNGTQSNYGSYPLRVQGSNQGIGITVDGSRSSANNFITFWDAQGMQGRIEGQLDSDVYNDPEFIFTNVLYGLKSVAQGVNIGIAAGASVVDPGNVGIEATNAALLIAEIAEYEIFAFDNLGVSYQSGAGDYAEWLPRLNTAEQISAGQIVGIFGGKVSRKTEGADMIMVVSSTPIVLGNTPPDSVGIKDYEKIGFMGQVPIWVLGKVNKGDFIIPYKSGTGFGKAVSPTELQPYMMDQIVGRAWDNGMEEINLINTVIGFNTNEWAYFAQKNKEEIDSLQEEIDQLKKQLNRTDKLLSRLIPGYEEALKQESQFVKRKVKRSPVHSDQNKTAYTKEGIETIFTQSEQLLVNQGYDISTHPFYSRINADPAYKEAIIEEILYIYNE